MNPEKKKQTTAATATAAEGEIATTAVPSTHETTAAAPSMAGVSNGDSNDTTSSAAAPSNTRRTPEMRRSAVRSLIQRYFYQLQNGCGNAECVNANCASSGQLSPMTANDMAARAIQLFTQDALLCETSENSVEHNSTTSTENASKVPRTESETSATTLAASATNSTEHESPTSSLSSLRQQDIDMVSPVESNSSSSTSTLTTSSSSSTASSISSHLLPLPSAVDTTAPSSYKFELFNLDNGFKAKNGISTSTTTTTSVSCTDFVNEEIIEKMVLDCKNGKIAHELLVHAFDEVFSKIERLCRLFYCETPRAAQMTRSASINKLHELLSKSPCELKKEDLRTLEGENDKDEDSTTTFLQQNAAAAEANNDSSLQHGNDVDEPMDADGDTCTSNIGAVGGSDCVISSDMHVDLTALRRIKQLIFELGSGEVVDGLINSIISLADSIKYGRLHDWDKVLHCLIICFDISTNSNSTPPDLDYMERALPKLCHAVATLPINAKARLARIWSVHCSDQLQKLVQCCQQIITLQVILDEENARENVDIIAVTKVLKIVFFASMLAGQIESPSALEYISDDKTTGAASTSSVAAAAAAGGSSSSNVADSEDDLFYYSGMSRPHMPKFAEDKLEQALQVKSIDCRSPFVPFEDFYNEPLSDTIQMHNDYLSYKNLALDRDPMGEETYFTFMLYAFILTPATKVIALYYDSRMRMYSERNSTIMSILHSFGGDGNDMTSRPDLKLFVRRDHIIEDALMGLELVACSNPKDLKKQLVVEFVGEQGIDEGGVSKEFFQLIVEEIFNPDFGMFVNQEETNTMWFSTSPFENGAQFTLIGIILGLAIYNNVILAVNFPMVVYRKLMGCRGTFYDLNDWNPTLYRSLKSLLDYGEQDMEEVFMQTFKISYTNVFGEMVEHELIPNGGEIPVGQHNKQEFVNAYSNYLLNESVEVQFKAFKKGFEMVTDESPLKLLFRPEEIELLVCGSRQFDFVELEKSTEYEGGYTDKTPIIKDFWSIVHSLPDESKRKLLEFTTGSDRIPVGGLSRLRLLITRHGPDSDRLPTSHTCFNVLLLPEYSNKEKLEERLLKAINYSKGFGML